MELNNNNQKNRDNESILKIAKRKRILIATGIFPPDIGGPASYGSALAAHLAVDYEVKVVTYSPVISRLEDKKLPYKVIRTWNKIPKILKHFIYFCRVFFAVKNSDIVFSLNAVSAGLPALWSAKFFKKKFYLKVVGDYAWEMAVNSGQTQFLINDFQKSRKSGRIKKLAHWQTYVAKKANRVIVPSEFLSSIVEGWGVSKGKIEVIYNGTEFKPSELTREEARMKIGVPGSIILSIGRLVSWKGFKMLIKIMPQLLEINQFFRLVIIGDGPDRKLLEAMVKNLRMEKKIFIVGKKSPTEIATYIKAAEIFVLNTGYEGFSHQILEVMAAGIPVITTAVGGNKEIIEQGENGFMVKYNDEFNLIEAIKSLWQEKELREHFIEEGKKTVEKFSFKKMLEQTKNILIS
jgi:glycosyltransferase involved in cell wall biosynthesis